jgi:hypothetical protein
MPVKDVNILIWLFFFTGYFLFDVVYSKFILAVQALDANKSATFSLILGTISFSAILGAGANPWYGVPCVLGQGAGAWCIIKYERWRQKKSNSSTQSTTI